MDFLAILGVLNDLPDTFIPVGPPYSQFVDSTGNSLNQFTSGTDGIMSQVLSFNSQPQDGWADVWGLLWNIPRNANESNSAYLLRLQETVLAWVGTVPAIQRWLDLFASGGTITENAGNTLGYALSLPPTLSFSDIIAFLITLNRIRPAGVPFTVAQSAGGVFLGTIDFMGSGSRVQGDYLSNNAQGLGNVLGATTLNFLPSLPGLLFVDPTINPSFAPQG